MWWRGMCKQRQHTAMQSIAPLQHIETPTTSVLPLCVDLDGTLILQESHRVLFRQVWKESWLQGMKGLWVFVSQGRLAFKWFLVIASNVQQASFTLRKPLFDMLRVQHKQGRKLWLVTGAPLPIAQHIVQKMALTDLFEGIAASSQQVNLTSARKAAWCAEKWDVQRFDYIGNSGADIAVWHKAHRCYSVCSGIKGRFLSWRLGKQVRVLHPFQTLS